MLNRRSLNRSYAVISFDFCHTLASYSSIICVYASPALAQPVIPPVRITLRMFETLVSCSKSRNHKAARVPRPLDEPVQRSGQRGSQGQRGSRCLPQYQITNSKPAWHDAYPQPREGPPDSIQRDELLDRIRSGQKAGKDFLLIDLRRNDHQVCIFKVC